MVELSRNSSSVLARRSSFGGYDPEKLSSLKSDSNEVPRPTANKLRSQGYFLVFLIIVIGIPIVVVVDRKQEPPTERTCETLLSVAKRAYGGQIDYIRRGLTTATASCLLTDFLNALVVRSEKTGTRKDPLGETCISTSFLNTLQFENGSLHSSAKLEMEIVNNNVSVPLLSHDQFPGDTSVGIAGEEWNRTAAYLSHTRDSRVNTSLLTLPSELTIRCDPHTTTTCAEFNDKFPNPLNLSVSAKSLTTQMTALVSGLIARGANATQATQLLLHNTAYVYLGTRCHKEDAAKLKVPLSFVREYGRLAGKLAKGNMVADSGKQGLSYKQVQACLAEQVDVLSGYASAGSVPEKIVGITGRLEEFVLRLERREVEDDVLTRTRRRMCKRWEETRVHGGCVYLADAVEVARRRAWVVREDNESGVGTGVDGCRAALAEGWTGTGTGTETETVVRVSVRERELCGEGWRYVEGMAGQGEAEIGNCCAEICVVGAVGLGSLAGREFMTGCCRNCNRGSCRKDGGEGEGEHDVGAEEKERLSQLTLEVPPYGTAEGLTRMIMV